MKDAQMKLGFLLGRAVTVMQTASSFIESEYSDQEIAKQLNECCEQLNKYLTESD